jgi:DNA-binding GntR family transcriptional regulator
MGWTQSLKVNTTLTDQLREAIEAQIVSGSFGPGERLEVSALAKKFNVSRTPVREALIQLSSLGFVEIRPHAEMRVTRLTMQGMLDVFEVLADLEGLAAELAARRINDGERERMRELHASCGESVPEADPSVFYDRNIRFHESIHAASRNPFLEQNLQSIRRRVSLYRRMRVSRSASRQQSWNEHVKVVNAIIAGDAEGARQAMRRHITMQGDLLQDFIATMPTGYFS